MIHSKNKLFDEVRSFLRSYQKFDKKVPIVLVPTTYDYIKEDEFFKEGVSMVIYANHLLRSSFESMSKVAENILFHQCSAPVREFITPIKKIIELIPNDGNVIKIPKPENFSKFNVEKINCNKLLQSIQSEINCFIGVPDSVLKYLIYSIDNFSGIKHIVTANEGLSVSMASGWHLANKEVPLVYMQNSGLGNSINPLFSLAHKETYGFPMILLIGWRGEPGVEDIPQHNQQGKQTFSILKSCGIEVSRLSVNTHMASQELINAKKRALENNCPVALLVSLNSFEKPDNFKISQNSKLPMRCEILEELLENYIRPEDFVISTTGYTSRELYTIEKNRGKDGKNQFLMVGSMGHALSLAQGVALAQPNRIVWCIDGDGSQIMHMGSILSSKTLELNNLRHILLDNSAHESVGGMNTSGTQNNNNVEFDHLAQVSGYATSCKVDNIHDFKNTLNQIKYGPAYVHVKISQGSFDNLQRPDKSLSEIKAMVQNTLDSKLNTKLEQKPCLSKNNDLILLTPGPLTTTTAVKRAMMKDLGSRDKLFANSTKYVLDNLKSLLNASNDYSCIPIQGSGTFAVEAMLTSTNIEHILILSNGAYGKRMSQICKIYHINYTLIEFDETKPITSQELKDNLNQNYSHVALVHCETTTGIINKIEEISIMCKELNLKLIIDAMSSFSVLDINISKLNLTAIAFSSNKGLQGPPGIGFCICKKEVLEAQFIPKTLSLDLNEQNNNLEKTGQWRFTPPTQVLLGVEQAIKELYKEGGIVKRRERYTNICNYIISNLSKKGYKPIINKEDQAPVIITFKIPDNKTFEEIENSAREEGFIIYKGKCTGIETFRVGCMGDLNIKEIEMFCNSI